MIARSPGRFGRLDKKRETAKEIRQVSNCTSGKISRRICKMICERSWLRKLQVDGVCLDIHGHRARDSWFKETARFLYHSPGKLSSNS